MKNPSPDAVISLREAVQKSREVGITAAQDYCADALSTSRRAWQQWERGERNMHRAFWELAEIKLTEKAPIGGD